MKYFLPALLFISHFSFAQNPLVKQWDYRFGGTDDDRLYSILQTTDGGYILGGSSESGISDWKWRGSIYSYIIMQRECIIPVCIGGDEGYIIHSGNVDG
ncbi:MAG TPA: hypothetical protein VE978_21150 [Chitinophagales bacterium]|nr:hypothetical protein [Chitinophagales bacterium]